MSDGQRINKIAATNSRFIELDHLAHHGRSTGVPARDEVSAMRIGAEYHDEEDIRYLLRHLDISNYDDALTAISKYYPVERFPQKTRSALAEILPKRS
jgi:hypothetical protein